MIKKILISIMVLSIMLVMVGTAAASITVVGGTVDDNGAAVLAATVKAYSDADCLTQLGSESGLTDISGEYSLIIPDQSVGTPVWVKAVKGERTGITPTTVTADIQIPRLNIVLANITMDIPEFSTVALPIAAVLGLMFIISSRKKEE
ncbi:MAG: PEF-CTERM sorting domain-containing protein [Bacteroidia bacterium]|nr:MAG: PEF-CTERM sorting domain-containing protein [Bacteroidia bacterium]